MSFCDKLSQLFKERSYNPEELAQKLGVTTEQIEAWKEDSTSFPLELLKPLAEVWPDVTDIFSK